MVFYLLGAWDGYKGIASLKMTCTLVCKKILLNSSLRSGTYDTEIKIFLLTSKPVSGFTVRDVNFFSGFLMIE